MGTWQANVFLAYASEDRKVAVAVQEAIIADVKAEGGGKVTVVKWIVNAEFTESILDNILFTMSGTDFGVFLIVFSRDPAGEVTGTHLVFGPFGHFRVGRCRAQAGGWVKAAPATVL